MRDITAQKLAEQLMQAKDPALLANGELEAFSYSIAHDRRATLGVGGSADAGRFARFSG
jgi:hypothetical protein